MIPKTRSFYSLRRLFVIFKSRYNSSSKTFTLFLLYLFFGFFSGNLFGTLVTFLRVHFLWDGFIGLFLIVCIETIGYFVYRGRKHQSSLFPPQLIPLDRSSQFDDNLLRNQRFQLLAQPKKTNNLQKATFLRSFNYFKIGLMLGFFIDAFKVGS